MSFELQINKIFLFCALSILFSGNTAASTNLSEKFLKMDGKSFDDGRRVELSWPKATSATGKIMGQISVQRRILGKTSKKSWHRIDLLRSFARLYVDKQTQSDVAYEYRISRPGKKKIERGYWVTGRNLPAQENRGIAIVIVDKTIAKDIAPYLDRFMLDLTGDGWLAVRHDVARGNLKDPVKNLKAARKLRTWIKQRYHSAPSTPHALILVGHIPVVKSGQSNPDGHKRRPLETDLFYADVDGTWHDNGRGVLRHNTIPGDHIEMQVGRIDFSNLDGAFGDEISLLKRYFDKNHHWRHGRLGDLRQAYGGNAYLTGETNALLNIVGQKNYTKGRHHDVGTQQPWLLGVDFGSWKYSDYATAPIKTVFSINFGSGKLDFSNRNNAMKAMLAQPWYALTTGWGSRPTWQLHHMALGKSIGYSHLRTVNNGRLSSGGVESLEYTPTGRYTWINPVWVNLLGDPTLRPFPATSVRNLRAKKVKNGLQLNWLKPDIKTAAYYRVYRAANRFGPYRPLNPNNLLTENQYLDTKPVPGAWYMVRSQSLKEVYAGSFYTFSQGVFTKLNSLLPKATDQFLSTTKGQKISVNLSTNVPVKNKTLLPSFITPPKQGRLIHLNDGWAFLPDTHFTGRVKIPFSVFNGVTSNEGVINIDIVDTAVTPN